MSSSSSSSVAITQQILDAEQQGSHDASSLQDRSLNSAATPTRGPTTTVLLPPPILPSCIALSLQQSCGYICKGAISSVKSNNGDGRNRSSDASSDMFSFLEENDAARKSTTSASSEAVEESTKIERIDSVNSLLECHKNEDIVMPRWAVSLLSHVKRNIDQDKELW